MWLDVFLWGAVAGLIHFVVIGAVYGNPVVDRLYADAQRDEPGVRRWDSKPRYLVTQFLGTQVEVFVLAAGYLWLRAFAPGDASTHVFVIGALFSGVRVYPRFWNMWIQSTYPGRLLAIEAVAGIISTYTVVTAMELLT